MAYIKVDHSRFEAAASAIDDYLQEMKKNMIGANDEVKNLSAAWQGKDFTQFHAQWMKVIDIDSTYHEMGKALESYAKYLRYAAGKYKKAQANAVNLANGLPR